MGGSALKSTRSQGQPVHACRYGGDRRHGDFELIVANAAHIKTFRGRKIDMNDAMWIADLQACALIKASFVPTEEM